MPAAILAIPRRAVAAADPSSLRACLVSATALIFCTVALLTRLGLMVHAYASGGLSLGEMPRVLLTGAAFDLVTSLYVIAPLSLYLALVPPRLLGHRSRLALYSALTLAIFAIAYLGIVEFFFFDEFNARFNFIAVEYLIYPHEVFVNIWQSYPVARGLVGAAMLTGGAVLMLRKSLADAADTPAHHRKFRLQAVVLLIALVVAHMSVTLDTGRTRHNRIADEISANGLYSFFNAAFNSRLEYTEFYLTVPEREAAARVQGIVAQANTTFIPSAVNPLARRVHYPGTPRPLNVVVLLEESLGSEFVGAYGDKRGLTPNIDALAAQSVVFTNTYASGTRTVRGMEAVTASFPPVPAESIVKRSGNEGMFNWSTVMRKAGYQPTFIYGGYGAFDNMNRFFSTNGYRVVDRTDMDTPRFSNIWGVSDEDLFEHAFKVFDQQHARGERIFSVVMTTSNHKPFTFPTGIDGVRPQGGGREAGVRYADHAIGRFIAELKRRPYFNDTAVVIVADHGARVYGKEDIPLHTYEIPFLVYAPDHFEPRRVDAITSQLDVAPTVLGLLGLSHDSAFFGRDVLAGPASSHAIPLNHNRDIALLQGDTLYQLGFRKSSSQISEAAVRADHSAPSAGDGGIADAASYFQLAYLLYSRRQYDAR